jgi:hypothetical protein
LTLSLSAHVRGEVAELLTASSRVEGTTGSHTAIDVVPAALHGVVVALVNTVDSLVEPVF